MVVCTMAPPPVRPYFADAPATTTVISCTTLVRQVQPGTGIARLGYVRSVHDDGGCCRQEPPPTVMLAPGEK